MDGPPARPEAEATHRPPFLPAPPARRVSELVQSAHIAGAPAAGPPPAAAAPARPPAEEEEEEEELGTEGGGGSSSPVSLGGRRRRRRRPAGDPERSAATGLRGALQAVLDGGARRGPWLRLREALRRAAPFAPRLAARAELAPLLEGLGAQLHASRALVADLALPALLERLFPRAAWDPSAASAALRAACPREGAGSARPRMPASPQPVFAGRPCPFAADWEAPGASGVAPPPDPVSLQELQRCLGAVGSQVAREETPWASSLGFMALTLSTDVPTEYPCAESPGATCLPFPMTASQMPGAALGPAAAVSPTSKEVATSKEPPLTGLQAAETFGKNWQSGKIQFLYLNVAPSRHFRPYDLVSVPKHLVNPQHYVFSPYGVLHVHPEEGTEALSLGKWHREAVLWQLMQSIPFFRLFLVRKAFVRWCFNVKHLQYLKCRDRLQLQLLQAVPHFGAALLHISRLLQELRSVHWLPTSHTKCFSFPELQRALVQENSNAQELLSRFLALCSSILELARGDTYKMVHSLQLQVENYKLYITKESLYNQRVQYEGLQRRLQEAESWLQRLGFLALLVNFLICQTLVSVMQEELTAFVGCAMKADGTARKAVLRVQLVFGEGSQLVLFPSSQELEDGLLGAMTTVLESVLKTTRISREKPESEQSPAHSASEVARCPSQPADGPKREPGKRPYTSGRGGQTFSEAPEQLQPPSSAATLYVEDPQLVHRLDLKAFGGLEVVGHRLRGEYPLLSREQLEEDLRSDPIIQEALAQQRGLLTAALSETQLLCREYAWLGEIYLFVHSWGPAQLESMKGWPAEEYVNRILKLRTWVAQVQEVPRVVITYNRLLLVDCSGIHQDILPLLASISQDILSLLRSETTQRSELLIAELSGVLQLFMNVGTDILTIAKCSQKLEQYQGQMTELQEYVDYVRALNEVIQQCFHPLSPEEESRENLLLDTWEAFVYQQREVSDFIVSRRLSIIAELRGSLQKAARELQEMLSAATVGRFQDPAQNPRAMEEELHALCQRFQATVVRAADLCRSQRILTGDCTDISFVTGQQGVIEIQARIWQLFRVVSEQITEWKCLAFVKFNTGLALEKTEEWQKEVISLEHCVTSHHPVLQACLRAIGNLQKYLPLLLKLGSQFLRTSCWKEIFAVMGVKCPLNMQFTLGQLLSYPLLEHSDAIFRVYASEKSRHHARDTLYHLERAWAEKQLRLINFILNVPYQEPRPERFRRPGSGRQRAAKLEYIPKDSGTYVLSDTAELKAAVEHSILTLQNMILSPFASDILQEAESWAATLRAFESILDAWVSFQQKWVFLNIVLYEMDISLPSAELDSRFQGVDTVFRELMQVTCNDPLVLSCVKPAAGSCRDGRFVGPALQATFLEGSGDLQVIIRALDYVLEATRMGFPRLFFLSNEELVALVATASEPADASAWSQRCFPGVRQLQMVMPSATQDRGTFSAQLPVAQVAGLVGGHGETLKLSLAISLSRKATQWLFALEQRMKESVFNAVQGCLAQRLALRQQLDQAFERPPGPTELPLHLVAESWATLGNAFPSQCVLLAEEALWRVAAEEALTDPAAQPRLQGKLSLKLEALAHYIRNYRSAHAWNPERDRLGLLLGSLILLTIQQRDTLAQLLEGKASSPQAFAWARLLKYHLALSPERSRVAGVPQGSSWVGSPPGCWVEVLDSRLPYDYEYLGPCLRLLGSPSLDRTFLGLLLALDEFRCGGLLGHPGAGKSHTVRGLAYALGRQLVTLHCTLQISVSCLARHLCGAVHAGALLLLESAERLEPGVLSAFSQRLMDLQRMCLSLHGGWGATPGTFSAQPSSGSPESADSEGSDGELVAALPELGLDESEPYQPRVLGNILFGGRLLRVREPYGCMVTMEHLPEPLRLAVRPLALLAPDLARMAEVNLLAAGFREAARLAEKLRTFLHLEGELWPRPPLGRPSLVREVIQTAVGILFGSSPGERDPPVAQARPSARTTFFLGLDEEPAMVKALSFSPLLSGPEGPRLELVRELLREVFPSASLQPTEPPPPPRLHGALVAQLQEDKLQPDPELLRVATLLAHLLQRGVPGVLLLGPSGSGKTAIWCTLAKALSRLAAADAAPGAQGTSRQRAALFQPISTTCFWPNVLSAAEFVGSLEGSIWQDGVLSRVLQRAAASASAGGPRQAVTRQWLVLDGSACAEWLEPIASLFGTRPSLSLPNGQRLRVPEHVQFLFEMPDASGMPPSVCTRCAILYCGGSTLWRALLASALAPLYRQYSLTQESLALLHDLAEELFPTTLDFLQRHGCPVLLPPHAQPHSPTATGIQETAAFSRILHALLEHYLRRDKVRHLPAPPEATEAKAAPSGPRSLDDSIPAHHHKLVQSIFVFAFVWGFGGHLHPRNWPLFDHFARRALPTTRLSVPLPAVKSVFDLCPQAEDGMLVSFSGQYLAGRVKGVPVSFSILPQFERVLFAVDLLLASDQPVLLVGEPGCGKSSFVETLVQPNHTYQRVLLTPALRAAHLRLLLLRRSHGGGRDKALFPMGKPARGPASKGRSLLLVEDLHMAFVDPARGASPVVESLRQALSHQQFYHPETLELQPCPAPGFNCLGTLSVPVAGALPLCPRFGRLFSTVVLPAMSRDSLLSMYTGPVLAWLEKFPLLTRHGDLASALVRGTIDIYEAAKAQFQPSPACCLFRFSLHDIQKVVRGLLLLRPRPGIHLTSPLDDHSGLRMVPRRSSTPGRAALGAGYTTLLSVRLIVRLWTHECLRVFCDRLRGKPQQERCAQMLMAIAAATFCAKRDILHVVPAPAGPPRAPLPSRTHMAFLLPSTSSCGPAAVEGEEEGAPCEEDLLPTLQAEPDLWWSSSSSSSSSSSMDHLSPWDPVEQAPSLPLEPPALDPLQKPPAAGPPECEAPEAEPEDLEVGTKASCAFQVALPNQRQATSRHPPSVRLKRRPSRREAFFGPLLPSHLLLLPGEEPRDLVFSREVTPEAYGPNAHNPYQEKQWKVLERQVAALLPPNLLLSSEGLRQLVRLSRLFCGSDRHGALVSFCRCTGQRTLVALVARATDTLLMELLAKADEAETLALLRLASWQAGVMGRRVVLLVHSGVCLAALHLVLALMADGTAPGLYGVEDHLSIIQALLQENPAIKRTMRDDLILQRFFQFVRCHLHVVLLLGGPGSLALPPLTASALAPLLSHLEVFRPWSQESLQEVAQKHFRFHVKFSTRLTREPTSLHAHKDQMGRMAKAAALIHSSATAYTTVLCDRVPLISPKSLLDFLETTVLLLERLQEQNNKQMDRMKLAVIKMEEVSKKQQEHTRDVHLLQQKLLRIREQVAQSQQEVEREQEVLKQQEKECRIYEARIDALTKERDALEKEKEHAMKKVSQDYKAALASLRAQDLEELRSYRQPPAPVVRVTDALCLMFHQEPGWENAKLLLQREDFYQDLVFYPKDTLSTGVFRALGEVLRGEGFSLAAIQSASHAAAALSQWISAVYGYHRALRNWQPTILQLQRCDEQINSEKTHLGDRRLHAEYLRDATQARIRELKLKQERQEKLLQQLTQSLQAKEEATTMESSVAEHLANWTLLTKSLESQQSTMYGDALLCAAALSYLGPFPPSRRAELLEKWQALCAGARVPLGPDDVGRLLQGAVPCPTSASVGPPLVAVRSPLHLASLLSSPREQRLWDRVHKPTDPESRLAAIILRSSHHARAHCWPLLVDPDKQALVWLLLASAVEEEEFQASVLAELVPEMVEQGVCDEIPEDRLEVLSLTDPDLEKNLRHAVSQNLPVLLTDFEKNVPWCPILQQLMQKESLQGPKGVLLHSESEEDVSVAPSFQMYLSTELPLAALASEIDHETLKNLNVIDLSLSPRAIEDLLLGEVLRAERREILKNRQALNLAVLHLEGKLEATEEELMELIAQPQRSLLEEENFMPMVRLLQTQIQALRATRQHMAAQHQDQAALCDKYRPVARMAGALQQALQQAGRLHPLYRFPTNACVGRLRQALLAAKRQDSSSKQESLEARLQELRRSVLQHLLVQALPSLRETDRLLVFFLGALATLQGESAVQPLEWLAFCGGLRGPQAQGLLQSALGLGALPPPPGWVSAGAWEQCCLLEALPAFRGLPASLGQRASQWQEYFRLPSTVVGLALCPSHQHLRPFQRALLWRILCPSAMSRVMADLTTCLLGWSVTEEMATTNPYFSSRTNRPILFLTAPEGSPGSYTHPLLWIQQMAAQRGRAGKVVVISFGTPDAARRVWRTLPLCARKGKWLVLSNCHLQERWDPDVLLQLEALMSTEAGQAEGKALEIHPKFRLWLITAADAPHSVPGPVHRNATILFCEMLLEPKAILARTHRRLQGQAPNLDAEQRLPLLVLYAVLMYRQAYARWTQASSYLWSHGEVLAGLRAQEKLSRQMDRSAEALQELAGTLLYGGHILDHGDTQAVQSLCRQCLAWAAHRQPGSGLQSFLAEVLGPPGPELSEEEAAAATLRRIEQLPSPVDPVWVGLCSGLQREVLAERSQVLLSALHESQGYWQPPSAPSWRKEERDLAQLVGQALALTQELQEGLLRCGLEVGARGLPLPGQPQAKARPLQRFLLEEAGGFLVLLKEVSRDLGCTQKRLQGEPCSSRRCHTVVQDLRRGHLPRPWLPYTPTGPQPLPAWLQTLQRRCQLLCTYLGSLGGQPVPHYQLAAFHHPRRLLLALLQEKARTEKQSVDTYRLDLQVLPSLLPPSHAPEKGVYLSGLELYHGLWNTRTGQLQETLSAQPCPLPPVWVQATRQPWGAASVLPGYQCPVYLGAPPGPVALGSHHAIMHVPLPTKMSLDLCAQRRVYAVSLLQ